MSFSQNVKSALSCHVGHTDREIGEHFFGSDDFHQKINTACRELEQRGEIERRKGDDGLIRNYLTMPKVIEA